MSVSMECNSVCSYSGIHSLLEFHCTLVTMHTSRVAPTDENICTIVRFKICSSSGKGQKPPCACTYADAYQRAFWYALTCSYVHTWYVLQVVAATGAANAVSWRGADDPKPRRFEPMKLTRSFTTQLHKVLLLPLAKVLDGWLWIKVSTSTVNAILTSFFRGYDDIDEKGQVHATPLVIGLGFGHRRPWILRDFHSESTYLIGSYIILQRPALTYSDFN